MKKKWVLATLVACAIALAGCKVVSEPEPVAVESVTLNATTLTLTPGETRTLTATVTPSNADDKTVAWSSFNADVVTVVDGTVTAVKVGTATITAQAGSKSATCTITVDEVPAEPVAPVVVESVMLSAETLTIEPCKTRKLTATVMPSNADDKSVKWLSSNVEVAMVSSDGTVVAIKTGTTIITAQAGDKTAICVIIVNDAAVVNPDSPVAVESVMLSTTTLTIAPGETRTLTATVTPSNADDKTVIWSSSDENIATVSDDGTITAHAEGTATITARAGGKEATCTVTVKRILIAVNNVTLNTTTLMLTRGDTGKLVATVTPDNADDTSVAWTSSNSDVVTVGNDGTVTAEKVGTAIIIAQAGEITAVCTVTVNPILVKNISLDAATLTLAPDMERKLTATVTPSNADDTTVVWSSSNSDVATVSNDGTVKAIKAGTAIITAQSGEITSVCIVTVHTDHSYSGGKCTLCGAKPYLEGGTINDNGVLTKYSGTAATVTIPDGVTSIGDSAFSNCTNLTSVMIPDSVTSIVDYAFGNCTNLKSVTIPTSMTYIGSSAFSGCTSLESVTIPDSVTKIFSEAFLGCRSLMSVTIPSSVTEIWIRAFADCRSLKSVTIPDGVTTIQDSVFSGCTSLESVTIPTSVTYIGMYAFNKCTNLTTVIYKGTLEEWKKINGFDKCGINNVTFAKQ